MGKTIETHPRSLRPPQSIDLVIKADHSRLRSSSPPSLTNRLDDCSLHSSLSFASSLICPSREITRGVHPDPSPL